MNDVLQNPSFRLDYILAVTAGLAGLVITVGSYSVDLRIGVYLGSCTIAAGLIYLISEISSKSIPAVGVRIGRGLDILTLSLITGMTVAWHTTPGTPTVFYWLLFITVGVILARCVLSPTPFVIVHIILLALTLRAAIWFSAPMVGHDPRFHQALAEYITHQGQIIPASSTYYRYYPFAHLAGASVHEVTQLSMKQAIFLGVGLPATLGIVSVFAITRRVMSHSPVQSGLFAIIILATIPAHVSRSGLVIAQSLELIFIATVILALIVGRDWRASLLGTGAMVGLLFTHNLSLMVLTVGLAVVWLFQTIWRYVLRVSNHPATPSHLLISGKSLVAVGTVVVLEYWFRIDYFDLQTGRLLLIFGRDTGARQTIQDAEFGPQAISIVDPILHLGIDLFLVMVLLGIGLLWGVRCISIDNQDPVLWVWLPTAAVLFTLVGIAFAAGGTDRVSRVYSGLVVVLAPVLGVVSANLGRKQITVIILCILLLTAPMLAIVSTESGTRNNLTPPTERAVTDYPAHQTESELAALKFGLIHTDELRTDSYSSGSAQFIDMRETPEVTSIGHQRDLVRSDLEDCSASTLYYRHYEYLPGIESPDSKHSVYSSGGGEIIQC